VIGSADPWRRQIVTIPARSWLQVRALCEEAGVGHTVRSSR